MKKQDVKKLGFGFSALVLGLSAVNFFPATGAYASIGGDWCTVEDIYLCQVEVTAPDNLNYKVGDAPLVFTGRFNAGLIVSVNGETVTDGLTITGLSFTFEFAPETSGDYDVQFMATPRDGDEIGYESEVYTVKAEEDWEPVPYMTASKTVNVGDSFEIKAANLTAGKYTDNNDTYEWTSVSDDEVNIEETQSGVFTVTALKAGDYMIEVGQVLDDGTTSTIQEINLLVVDIRTEAAKTIKDILSSTESLEEAYNDAAIAYQEAVQSGDTEAAEAAKIKAKEALGSMESASFDIQKVFGDYSNYSAIMDAVYDGKTITTDVSVDQMDAADVAGEVKEALLSELDATFAANVKYYDIDVDVYADGELVGNLKELTSGQVIVISGFDGPAAGFNRVFKVVRYHTYTEGYDENGNPIEKVSVEVIDDVEFDEATGSIIFSSDKFSTYAVSYADELAASVDTGMFTAEGASASASVATSVVVAALAVALFSAFKFAKSRQN